MHLLNALPFWRHRLATWLLALTAVTGTAVTAAGAQADDFVIDTEGAHAFIQFRIKHLGFSWLYGRFNDFSGEFTFDENNPANNKIRVDIDVASIDSMHAERDKHLRGEKFLNTEAFPKAQFVSTAYKPTAPQKAELQGNLTLHGVTKPISIEVERIGGGNDPWGGYRQGFEGRITIKPADFGMDLVKALGPSAAEVELFLSVEGIRKPSTKLK
jgi:polyisoprenoid-binding protein YceI